VLEPLNEADLETDLWALLRWMIEGVGGEWRVEELDATGRLYQLAAAGAATLASVICRPARAHRLRSLAYARQSHPLRRSSPSSRRRELQALRRRPGRTAPAFCATGQE
jgi:hypothetical protein